MMSGRESRGDEAMRPPEYEGKPGATAGGHMTTPFAAATAMSEPTGRPPGAGPASNTRRHVHPTDMSIRPTCKADDKT